ncbi:putative protein kinase [Monocercomonoides exilis]|uniref:putative protein kinase n=1 Tax=Monocercomonoides exilis TaxID=2049356 RepID=UPI0035594E29|nr:putative protein kinase [Monocercomonoides exilis]|eukprot:MONOS_9645.1-p1 / transcript=MONOS_9645.1 / gene=MONOS_9645 / organism=Monocercomonoides_exilis_PA203 / gene_product=protein kinase / transcript_product=protein kinase / location=Mono_scaffold00405:35594-36915(+) / protein_length=367 / sequence_SO=supercontig / SO=protein_coding / is_pseudo=false
MTKKAVDNTILFFDWDDTMLASSVLCSNEITLQTPIVPPEIISQFETLQEQVIKMINIAYTFTKNVFIITNAEHGWVELSAEKFMPKIRKMLDDVQVVSARTTYQNTYPNQPNMWKKTAFVEKINSCFCSPHSRYPASAMPDINVISFGDSECERNALLSLGRCNFVSSSSSTTYPVSRHSGPMNQVKLNLRLKSIKFVERPTTEQLKRQIEMIQNNFHFIVKHEGSLDLMLQISTLHAQSPSAEEDTPAGQATPGGQAGGAAGKDGRGADGRTRGTGEMDIEEPDAANDSSMSTGSGDASGGAASQSGAGGMGSQMMIHDDETGEDIPYSSPDGKVPEEMRKQLEEAQRLKQKRRIEDGGMDLEDG